MARLRARRPPDPSPTRVLIDLRPLQEAERMPITAEYLARLTDAYAATPLVGESFVAITRALRPDPTVGLELRGLMLAGRRVLPPTGRVLRSAGLTLDSFLLRAAEIGAGARAEEGSAAADGASPPPTVYHTAGGAVPLASRLPLVATLLDLAPWELPHTYAASPAARLGHRLRARVLHDAARIIVCSRATADSARRLLNLPPERLAVVPLAVDDEFRAASRDQDARAAFRRRFALPERYLLFGGRYDARKDLATLLSATRTAAEGDEATERPPLVLAGLYDAASDEEALQRAVARGGAAAYARVLPSLTRAERGALVGGALAFVYPALSEATGLPVLEALAAGVPVICSRAGVLPEMVGGAGIIVEPRDVRRMASAIAALSAGGALADQLTAAARRRASADKRSWADVARDTRHVYAEAARSAGAQAAPAGPTTASSAVSG